MTALTLLPRPSRRARVLVVLLAILGLTAGLFVTSAVVAPAPANALSGSDFRAGNIISDEAFFNSTSMNAADVQRFLNSQVSSCQGSNGQPCLKDYTETTSTRAASSYCSQYTGQANETAAQIISRVGLACGINPQVILVMLQKEQGLVQSSSPTAYMYRSAMGYGCPDTAACDSQYYGFFNQVYSAARQFQSYTKNSGSWSYQPGRNNNILYNPNSACGSSPVFIENQATANLYIYTPYQPNAAALANLGGAGDSCSAYGNRNFWVYFNTWFPNTGKNWLQSPSFEGGSVDGWGAGNGFINRATYQNPSLAQSGDWFLASNTSTPWRSISQDVPRQTSVDEQVTATIWLRSGTDQPFTGQVTLWGLGGSGPPEHSDIPFTVGSSYQQITVKLPIRQSDRSVIRLEVYEITTNQNVFIDNASMTFGSAPAADNLLRSGSFETQFLPWKPGNGFANGAHFQADGVPDGNWMGAANTPVAGRSIAQDVTVAPSSTPYTLGIWLRNSGGGTFNGTLALWGIGGGATRLASTPYAVGSDWTYVTTTLPADSSVTLLRAEIYLDTTTSTVFFDDATLGHERAVNGSFESGFDSWNRRLPSMNQAVYTKASSGIAPADGSYFAATNTPVANGSVFQDISWTPSAGDVLQGDIWLRSDGAPLSGTLALWALGGSGNEVGSQAFSVGPDWTRVHVRLPIYQGNHSTVRLEVYLNTGATLFLDGAHVY